MKGHGQLYESDLARQFIGLDVMSHVLVHGLVDYHLVIAAPPVGEANHMQEWFQAGAVDSFRVSPDVY